MRISLQSIWTLALRNIKCYLRDKTAVFFSFLSPLIILMLYLLFLGDIQNQSLLAIFQQAGLSASSSHVSQFVASWLISGVMSVTALTVTLGASEILVSDKAKNVQSDFYVAPVSKLNVLLSYVVSVFIISFSINVVILFVAQIYLLSLGAPMLSFISILKLIGITFLSILSSTFLILFIVSFLSSSNAFAVVSTLVGTLIGFLIGAYMPISMFPTPIQFISNLMPASYSNSFFKSILMEPILQNLTVGAGNELTSAIRDAYSMDLYLGDTRIKMYVMLIVLIVSVFVFMLLALLRFKKLGNTHLSIKTKKLKNKK